VFFQLRVRNAVGWSPWGETSPGITTSPCKPAPPDAPRLISILTHSLSVTWDKPDDHGAEIIDYTLVLLSGEASHRIDDLLRDSDQRAQVEVNRAIDTDGDGKLSMEELKAAMRDPEIRAVVASLSDQRDALLQAELVPKEFPTIEAPKDWTDPRHTFEGLVGGVEFSVAVRARNSEGDSEWSLALRGLRTPCAVPEQCLPPVMLEAEMHALRCEFRLPYDNGDPITHVEFQWHRKGSPIDQYLATGGRMPSRRKRELLSYSDCDTVEVLLPTGAGALARAPPWGHGGVGEGVLPSLHPGTEYEVRVRAVNGHGAGAFSPGVKMVCLAGAPEVPSHHRHADATSRAVPPQVEGQQVRDLLSVSDAGDDGEVDTEVLPTVFFGHTGRLQEHEVVSVAAQGRRMQERRSLSALEDVRRCQPDPLDEA